MRLEPHIIRRALAASQCPWCARVLDNIALHTNLAHGVNARELRKMAEVGTKTSICSPGLSANAREHLLARPDREAMTRSGSERAQASRAWERASEAAVARTERLHTEQWERAETLFASSGRTFEQIAAEVGLHPRTLARGLRERGHDVDEHTRRARRINLLSAAVPVAAASRRSRAREQADQLVARFRELGGDWSAVIALAAEREVTEKTMRGFLRKHGASVPDGRQVSFKRGRAGGRVYSTKEKQPCTALGCDRDATRRGMCDKHYRRWRTTVGEAR